MLYIHLGMTLGLFFTMVFCTGTIIFDTGQGLCYVAAKGCLSLPFSLFISLSLLLLQSLPTCPGVFFHLIRAGIKDWREETEGEQGWHWGKVRMLFFCSWRGNQALTALCGLGPGSFPCFIGQGHKSFIVSRGICLMSLFFFVDPVFFFLPHFFSTSQEYGSSLPFRSFLFFLFYFATK